MVIKDDFIIVNSLEGKEFIIPKDKIELIMKEQSSFPKRDGTIRYVYGIITSNNSEITINEDKYEDLKNSIIKGA